MKIEVTNDQEDGWSYPLPCLVTHLKTGMVGILTQVRITNARAVAVFSEHQLRSEMRFTVIKAGSSGAYCGQERTIHSGDLAGIVPFKGNITLSQ